MKKLTFLKNLLQKTSLILLGLGVLFGAIGSFEVLADDVVDIRQFTEGEGGNLEECTTVSLGVGGPQRVCNIVYYNGGNNIKCKISNPRTNGASPYDCIDNEGNKLPGAGSEICFAYRRSNESLSQQRLTCDPGVIVFEDKGAVVGRTGEGFVFRRSDGGGAFVRNNFFDGTFWGGGVCRQNVEELPIVRQIVGTARNIVGSINSIDRFCNELTFEQFKNVLAQEDENHNSESVDMIVAGSYQREDGPTRDRDFSEEACPGVDFDNLQEGDTFECQGIEYTVNENGNFVDSIGGTYTRDGAGLTGQTTVDTRHQGLASAARGAGERVAGALLSLILAILDVIVFLIVLVAQALFRLAGFIFINILLINPASPQYLGVVGEVWNILAGIANLLIIGALIFFGITKVSGLKPQLTDDISGIILKLVVYSLLLTFVFWIPVLMINLGFGLGFLLIAAMGENPSTFQGVSAALIGGFIDAIGSVGGDLAVQSVGIKAIFGGIAVDKVMQSLGRRIIELVVLGAGAFAFYKNFKVMLFQRLRMFFDMAFSAITLALFFNPIKSAQTQGQKYLNRLLIDAFFTPAYIGALIIAAVLVSALGDTVNDGVSSSMTAGSSGGLGDDILRGIAGVVSYTIIGAFAVGALLIIPDWFAKKYEDDMKAVGGAVKSGVGGLGKGLGKAWGVTKGANYLMGGVSKRLIGKNKKGEYRLDNWVDAMDRKAKTSKGFSKYTALAGRGVGELLNGQAAFRMEEKAKTAKAVLVDSFKNERKAHEAGIKESEKERAVLTYRTGPLKFLSERADMSNAVGHRGQSEEAINEIDMYQKDKDAMARGRGSVIQDISVSRDELAATARVEYKKELAKATKADGSIDMEELTNNIANNDALTDAIERAAKDNDNVIMEMLANMNGMKEATRKALSNNRITDKNAVKNINDNYYSFSDSFNEAEVISRATKDNYTFSKTDLQDPRIRAIVKETYQDTGNTQKLAELRAIEESLPSVSRRAAKNMAPLERKDGKVVGDDDSRYNKWLNETPHIKPEISTASNITENTLNQYNTQADINTDIGLSSFIENTPEIKSLVEEKVGRREDIASNEQQRMAYDQIARNYVRSVMAKKQALKDVDQYTAGQQVSIKGLEEVSNPNYQTSAAVQAKADRKIGLGAMEGRIKRDMERTLRQAGLNDAQSKIASNQAYLQLTKSLTDPNYTMGSVRQTIEKAANNDQQILSRPKIQSLLTDLEGVEANGNSAGHGRIDSYIIATGNEMAQKNIEEKTVFESVRAKEVESDKIYRQIVGESIGASNGL